MKIKSSIAKLLLLVVTVGIAYGVLYSQPPSPTPSLWTNLILNVLPMLLGSIVFFGPRKATKIILVAGIFAFPLHLIAMILNPHDQLGYGYLWGGITAISLFISAGILAIGQKLFSRMPNGPQSVTKSKLKISWETGMIILASLLLVLLQISLYFFVLYGPLAP